MYTKKKLKISKLVAVKRGNIIDGGELAAELITSFILHGFTVSQ